MNGHGLLKAWQVHHGPLSPEYQREFLLRPEVEAIIEYSNRAIEDYLPTSPKLKRLLAKLRSDGRAAVKKSAAKPRTVTSTRRVPRTAEANSNSIGLKPLKEPNSPNQEKTKTKKDRPNRDEMNRLRRIAQSKKSEG